MKQITNILLIFLLSLCGSVTYAQLVTNQQNPATLVQNTLLGPGVTVSNINYSGAAQAIGYFNGSNTNIGLDEGIIITTGTISAGAAGPYGPNNQASAGMDNGAGAFAPLSNIVNASTFNSAVLSFNFVPFSDSVRFRYVFASEEYPEFANTQFNDVFAFFISGPGFAGPTNIAKIPGTGQEVAINSINNGQTNTGPCENCGLYVNNGDGSTAPQNGNAFYVQYDGFTRVLEANAKVQCGETYQLTIAIADVSDAIYDSGIFLEANSLSSDTPVLVEKTLSSQPFGNDYQMAEGCTSATVTVSRSGTDVQFPLSIPVTVTGTATEGADYDNVPNSINFAAGQTTTSFTVNAFADGVAEGSETINMEFAIVDPCGNESPQTIQLEILDIQDVEVSVESSDVLCPGEEVQLIAEATGGGGNYTYSWDTGETTSSIFVSPTSTATYTVTVTDDCLNQSVSASGTVTVPVFQPLTLNATGDIVEQCPFVPFDLTVEANGGAGQYTYQWSDDQGNNLGTNPLQNVVPSTTTLYTVVVTDLCGNQEIEEVLITILSPPLLLDISPSQEVCPGDPATITVTATGGFGNYYYFWPHSGETTATITVNPFETTSYFVIVKDDCQTFQVTASTEVVVVKPDADFIISSHTLFEDLPITFQNLTENGNFYEWEFGDGQTSTMVHPNNTYDTPDTYFVTLIATDLKGCKDTIVKPITIKPEVYVYVPNTFTPDGNRFNSVFKASTINVTRLNVQIYNRWGETVFESDDINFEWDGTYVDGQIVPDGTYVYKIYYESVNDDEETITGHINVLR